MSSREHHAVREEGPATDVVAPELDGHHPGKGVDWRLRAIDDLGQGIRIHGASELGLAKSLRKR